MPRMIIHHKADGTFTINGEPGTHCPRCNCEVTEDQVRDGSCYFCREFEAMIKAGLRHARLEPLPNAQLWRRSSPMAALGSLEITHSGRGWHNHFGYWVVAGKVPLATAKLIYADPVGRDLIRAAGHCMCPPPEEWAHWYMPDGRQVSPIKSRAECEQGLNSGSPSMVGICQKALRETVFSDDPASIGAEGFIEHYDIDGDLGLRVFVDIIRQQETPAHALAVRSPEDAIAVMLRLLYVKP